MAESSQEFGTVIGADASFKGDLKFESAAKVLGRFEGSIQSKGMVHIADGAACKAMIAAKEVSVAGRIDGNVEAGDRIELTPTGVVSGDIVISLPEKSPDGITKSSYSVDNSPAPRLTKRFSTGNHTNSNSAP